MPSNVPFPSGPVLVTGAAKGLGAAIAVALAESGIEPLLLGRSSPSLDNVRARVEPIFGRPVRTIIADVSDWQALHTGIAESLVADETLRGLVNNAGVIDPIDRIEESDPEEWLQCMQVNLYGAYLVLRASLAYLPPGAVIANISSGAAAAEHAGWSAYAASKAGLERLSATLAGERPDLVVYAVRPGITDTGMQSKIKESRVDNAVRKIPREAMQPVDVPASAIGQMFVRRFPDVTNRVVEASVFRTQ